MLYIDNFEDKINHCIEHFAIRYYKTPNFVGFGLGKKQIDGYITSIPALTFFVNKKLPSSELHYKYLLPKTIDSIITDVVEISSFSTNPYTNISYQNYERIDKYRPAFSGLSCSNESSTKECEGCITAAVTDHPNKRSIYFLSCNHVLTSNFSGTIADAIVQPASIYTNSTRIGSLGWVCILHPKPSEDAPVTDATTNSFNIALTYVGPNNPQSATREIYLTTGIGKDKIPMDGTATPKINDAVWKIGPYPTLTKSKGSITHTNVTVTSIKIKDKFFAFTKQNLAIIPFNRGDSGAMLMKKRGIGPFTHNDAVGMCIGSFNNPADNKNYTLFTSIESVLSKLRVELLT